MLLTMSTLFSAFTSTRAFLDSSPSPCSFSSHCAAVGSRSDVSAGRHSALLLRPPPTPIRSHPTTTATTAILDMSWYSSAVLWLIKALVQAGLPFLWIGLSRHLGLPVIPGGGPQPMAHPPLRFTPGRLTMLRLTGPTHTQDQDQDSTRRMTDSRMLRTNSPARWAPRGRGASRGLRRPLTLSDRSVRPGRPMYTRPPPPGLWQHRGRERSPPPSPSPSRTVLNPNATTFRPRQSVFGSPISVSTITNAMAALDINGPPDLGRPPTGPPNPLYRRGAPPSELPPTYAQATHSPRTPEQRSMEEEARRKQAILLAKYKNIDK